MVQTLVQGLRDNERSQSDEDRPKATPWVPETPGEGIEGIFKWKTTFESKFVDQKTNTKLMQPAWFIETDDGQYIMVVGNRTVLRNEMEKAAEDNDLEEGDRVAIIFYGQRETKSGTSFFKYGVAVQKQGEAPPF